MKQIQSKHYFSDHWPGDRVQLMECLPIHYYVKGASIDFFRIRRFTFAIAISIVFTISIAAQDVEIGVDPAAANTIEGPALITLGDNIAEVNMADQYVFLNAQYTQMLLSAWGNTPSGNEMGMITPKDTTQSWSIIFEYEPIGYVKDDEKDDIDSKALLESYQEGAAQQNEIREERGLPKYEVLGWYEAPHYDEASNNLVWAILAKEEAGDKFLNYNTKLLGREGYMSVLLIASPDELDRHKGDMENVIANFSYTEGKRYGDFVQGDKVAEYGLMALMGAGAGLAAAKLGFFALAAKFLSKMWKIIVVALIAVGGAIKKIFFSGRSGSAA